MKNKVVLIIGGTGSWGDGLITELLKEDILKIKVFARNEFQMVMLMRKYNNPKIEIIIGDIRDYNALEIACENVDIVYHLAALKHVPICEQLPDEAIETNIFGTQNVIDASIANDVDKVIFTSTDKAVNPNCTYGSTKMLGEKLILSANNRNSRTKFIVFRGGNLIGSTGSVIPLFEDQILEKGSISLTDENMNRFFISVHSASQLLIKISKRGIGGEIYIPNMPSIFIRDIAKYILNKWNINPDKIELIGKRPGEKISEVLVAENERKSLYRFDESLFIICNDQHGWLANGVIQHVDEFNENSAIKQLSYNQVVSYLKSAGV